MRSAGLSAVWGSIGVVRRRLCPIVGGLVAIAGRGLAVAGGQVAVVCRLFAVDLGALTVAPCPASGLLGRRPFREALPELRECQIRPAILTAMPGRVGARGG